MLKNEALLKSKEPLEFWRNDEPKCPHCGKECTISENEWWNLYEEGEHTKECPSCESEFLISTNVEYSFSTDQQDD
jgi:hypothetical protein